MSEESLKGTGWVLEVMKKQTKKAPKTKKTKSFVNVEELFYCKQCNTVWEWPSKSNYSIHYGDFPTYGLTRKCCKVCKERMTQKT